MEDKAGDVKVIHRSDLRHRVLKTMASIGVSDDPSHDSYAMRHFVESTFSMLHESGTLSNEKIHALAVHSDNAAQHFKSSKSIDWLTFVKDLPCFDGIDLQCDYEFGAPGHGKGVWDGCFGIMK